MSFDKLQKTLEANNENQEINIIKTEILSLKDQIERILLNKIKDTKVDILKVSLSQDSEIEALNIKIKSLKERLEIIANEKTHVEIIETAIVSFRKELEGFETTLSKFDKVLTECKDQVEYIEKEHGYLYKELEKIDKKAEKKNTDLQGLLFNNKKELDDKIDFKYKASLNEIKKAVGDAYELNLKDIEKIKLLIPDKYDDKGLRNQVKNIDLKLHQVLKNLESQINQNFKVLAERIKAANSVIVTRGGGSGSGGGGINAASQAEVNAGVINDKAVTPLTLHNTTNIAKLLYVSKYGQEIDTTGDNPISYHLFELSSDATENKWIAKRVSHGTNGATAVTYGTNLNNTTITNKANAFNGIKDLTFVSSLNTAGVST